MKLRRPEPVLALVNVVVLGYLFIDSNRGIESLHDVYLSVLQLSPMRIDRAMSDMLFGLLLAPVLLPVTFFIIMPMVYMNIGRFGWSQFVLYGSFLPNAILWGECTMYLYRLVRTGSHREASAQMLTWWRRGAVEAQSRRGA